MCSEPLDESHSWLLTSGEFLGAADSKTKTPPLSVALPQSHWIGPLQEIQDGITEDFCPVASPCVVSQIWGYFQAKRATFILACTEQQLHLIHFNSLWGTLALQNQSPGFLLQSNTPEDSKLVWLDFTLEAVWGWIWKPRISAEEVEEQKNNIQGNIQTWVNDPGCRQI